MPGDFHFLRPEWLLAVPLVALFARHAARRLLTPGSWLAVIDPALQPHVLARGRDTGIDWRWWLVFVGGTLAAVALAGPAWQRIEQPVYRSAQAMVIALDLSRSMDAQDVSPSRLARAKLKLLDILGHRQSGQTALVVYSGNAFTVTPLTTDTDTIAALVGSLSTDIMPSQGSNPAAAIQKARQLLGQAGTGDGRVLLIADGGVTPAALEAAEELADEGHSLSVLAVGTLEGAPIPEAGGGFLADRSGQIAVPKLELGPLKQLADAGGGRFAALATDNADLNRLRVGDFGTAGADGGDDALATDQWRDEGPWVLLLLVPLAALGFRRGWVLALCVFALPPGQAQAFEWQDLWRTPDQQGKQALEDGRVGEAAELFDDRAWRGVAAYRAGDWSASAAAFAGRDDPDGTYNLGNALARQGKLEAALEAWERTLELDPDDEDAAYNRDLVKKLLEEQKSAGQQGQSSGNDQQGQNGGKQSGEDSGEQQGQQAQSGSTDGSANPESGRQAGEPSSQEDLDALQRELERAAREAERQQQGDAGEPTDPAELAAERRAQERAQAMEQWLRRIPDDPGGLLRRKFRYQYQRQGIDQDGNALSNAAGDPW
ncbi:MAG TPA: VWA domain-containing protein [Woeseiaceae bacterium]